jgi:hypothetical protein
MPQATKEQRDRWPGGDTQAMKVLADNGYKLTDDGSFRWIRPKNHKPTEIELDAVDYLVNEWDYGFGPISEEEV